MFIKTSNAALGSFSFLVLSAIFVILHNLVSSLIHKDEPFFSGLFFVFFLGFLIFTIIFFIKLFSKLIKKRPPEFVNDMLPIEEQSNN